MATISKELQELESTLHIVNDNTDITQLNTTIIELNSTLELMKKNLSMTNIKYIDILTSLSLQDLNKLKLFLDNIYTNILPNINDIIEYINILGIKDQLTYPYHISIENLRDKVKQDYTNITNTYKEIQQYTQQLELDIAKGEQAKKHLISCPNCTHKFSLDYDDKKHQTNIKTMTVYNQQLINLSKDLKNKEITLSHYQQLLFLINNYNNYLNTIYNKITNPKIVQLLKEILDYIFNTSKDIQQLILNIQNLYKIKEIENTITDNKKLLSIIQSTHTTSISNLKTLFETKVNNYSLLINNKELMEKEYKQQLLIHKLISELNNKLLELRASLTKIDNIKNKINKHFLHEYQYNIIQTSMAYVDKIKKDNHMREDIAAIQP